MHLMYRLNVVSDIVTVLSIKLRTEVNKKLIRNVNFLQRHRTRTTAHNKVHFAYGKHTDHPLCATPK